MKGHGRAIMLAAVLLAAPLCDDASAKRLFRCDTGNGTSFQDTPCAKPETQEVVGQFTVEEVPPEEVLSWVGQAPVAPKARPPGSRQPPYQRGAAAPVREEPQGYRCVASNGEVFYRLDHCPDSVNHGTNVSVSYDRYSGNAVTTTTPTYNEVTTQRVSRREACKQMDSIANRSRRERDKDGAASSYDRNLGRDPCK